MGILFRDLVDDNINEIKSYMRWENYDLNNVEIPVTELVKDHALTVLKNSYGMFHVEQSILNELNADIFTYFPILLQQLSITRLIDAYGVVTDDIDTVTTTRTENIENETDESSSINQGTSQTNTDVLNTQTKTVGTVDYDEDVNNAHNSTTNIENTSGVESTGTKNVNISHNLPEQAMAGGTGYFPVDGEGVPILTGAYVQDAQEGFTSSNPINSNESSSQIVSGTDTGTNNSTTINDQTISDSGTNTKTIVNSGTDTSDATILSTGSITFNEEVTSKLTNKQYAYEIKAFLETADGLVAFEKWQDRFSWVVGIL